MSWKRRQMRFILGILCLAGLARAATVCGVPVEHLNEAIQFRVYWFGRSSVGGYRDAGTTINADCLIGQSLTVIGIKSLYMVLGGRTFGQRSEWVYIQGGFGETTPQDLGPYFANIEQSIAPIKRSFAETWEDNRRTVEDMRGGRIPPQPQPRQHVTATTERYRLPELLPPTSQSQHTLDTKFVRRVLDLVRSDLQKNMAGACPCAISAPYFGPGDPMLYVLIEFRDGQVAADSYHRDPVTGEPRQDDFLYHSNDSAHRFLVSRLKDQTAVVDHVN
jgi:hypothetical protein